MLPVGSMIVLYPQSRTYASRSFSTARRICRCVSSEGTSPAKVSSLVATSRRNAYGGGSGQSFSRTAGRRSTCGGSSGSCGPSASSCITGLKTYRMFEYILLFAATVNSHAANAA